VLIEVDLPAFFGFVTRQEIDYTDGTFAVLLAKLETPRRLSKIHRTWA
jgi:hypothetical protein